MIGYGELECIEIVDLQKMLEGYYEFGCVNFDSVVYIGEVVDLLIVVKFICFFFEKDKFKIDQYVMQGGKVLWLLDKVWVDLDSLQGWVQYYFNEYDFNLDDLLFCYGICI